MSTKYCMGCGKDCTAEPFTDPVTKRPYCAACAAQEVTSSRGAHFVLLDKLLPVGVGSRVECRAAGEHYEGTGVIVEISTQLEHGGTPVHPAYLVQLDESTQRTWYTSCCLTKVEE